VACLQYAPVGVVGAIVPFNYPFHNVFNPLIAALFAGNALVIKVLPVAAPPPRPCSDPPTLPSLTAPGLPPRPKPSPGAVHPPPFGRRCRSTPPGRHGTV